MSKFAANLTLMFTEVPFLDRFAAAAKAGFTAVEFWFPYDYSPAEIAGKLRENNLEAVLFNMPPGNVDAGEFGIGCLPGRQADFRAGLATAIPYANELGVKYLHAIAGLVPAGLSEAQCREVYIENLKYAAAETAKHGITVVIEPINLRNRPGFLLHTIAQAHDILAAVNAPNLKIQMDLFHMQIAEGDLAMKIHRYLPEVGYIQFAGVPERHEPNIGELNYQYLFRLLDDLGYTGWLGCEYVPAGDTVAGLKWLQTV